MDVHSNGIQIKLTSCQPDRYIKAPAENEATILLVYTNKEFNP